jgi:hypothetical protein
MNKRRGLLVFLSVGVLYAGTLIQELHIVGPDGLPAIGTITYVPTAAFTTLAGNRVEIRPAQAAILNGVLRITLEPNDTAIPANTQYVVTWKIRGGTDRITYWTVPTTSSTLSVKDVEVAPLLPSVLVPSAQITWGGLADGCLVIVGGRLKTQACTGGSALSWTLLTSGQWASLTSDQWTSLTN